MLRKAYEAANPHGSLYLLIDRIPKLSYTPAKEAHKFYKTLSEGLKTSYFGQMYADCMARMEQLAEGKPAPDFTLATTEDRTVAKADFKGRYLLLYHWGLCPGSIHIDRQVSDLFEKYKDKGLQVVGLTESIADIRSVYESLPAGKKRRRRVWTTCAPCWPACWNTDGSKRNWKPVIRKTGRSWKRMPSKAGRSSF